MFNYIGLYLFKGIFIMNNNVSTFYKSFHITYETKSKTWSISKCNNRTAKWLSGVTSLEVAKVIIDKHYNNFSK
jgi:hypothetical protein